MCTWLKGALTRLLTSSLSRACSQVFDVERTAVTLSLRSSTTFESYTNPSASSRAAEQQALQSNSLKDRETRQQAEVKRRMRQRSHSVDVGGVHNGSVMAVVVDDDVRH